MVAGQIRREWRSSASRAAFPARGSSRFWRNLRDGVESIARLLRRGTYRRGRAGRTARSTRPTSRRRRCSPDVDLFDAALLRYSPREAAPHGSAAAAASRDGVGSLRGCRRAPAMRPGPGRRLCGDAAAWSRATCSTGCRVPPTCRADRRRRPYRQRQGLSQHPHLLQAQPDRAEPQRPDGLLDVAGRGASRLSGDPRGECDMALAGAATVASPSCAGYSSMKGGILSPDGHCRAFDAGAQGTIFGSGRRRRPAQGAFARRSPTATFYAVDPRHGGQQRRRAQSQLHRVQRRRAGDGDGRGDGRGRRFARRIGYVECHGTGTIVGDPPRDRGSRQALRPETIAAASARSARSRPISAISNRPPASPASSRPRCR